MADLQSTDGGSSRHQLHCFFCLVPGLCLSAIGGRRTLSQQCLGSGRLQGAGRGTLLLVRSSEKTLAFLPPAAAFSGVLAYANIFKGIGRAIHTCRETGCHSGRICFFSLSTRLTCGFFSHCFHFPLMNTGFSKCCKDYFPVSDQHSNSIRTKLKASS